MDLCVWMLHVLIWLDSQFANILLLNGNNMLVNGDLRVDLIKDSLVELISPSSLLSSPNPSPFESESKSS